MSRHHVLRARRSAIGLLAAAAAAAALTVGIATGADAAFTPQQVYPAIKTVQADLPPVNAGKGVTWNGPAVAIIDTGVQLHEDLNVKAQIDCTGLGSGDDGQGHGTAVAGAIAAIDNDRGIVGVAPGAPIYGIRVLDSDGSGTVDMAVCALQWVIDNAAKYNIRVVNMSVDYPGADDENCGYSNNDRLHQKICELDGKGIVFAGSANNYNRDYADQVPAAYNEVLTATNIQDFDGAPGGRGTSPCPSGRGADDQPHDKSNFAVSAADQAHTIGAPGTCPYSTLRGAGNRYGYVGAGTSLAASAVSGVMLDCLVPGGACVGKTAPQIRQIILDQARASALKGHVYDGDPLHPRPGKYYGYLLSAQPVGGSTPPTSTSSTRPTSTTSSVSTSTTSAPPTSTTSSVSTGADRTPPTVSIIDPPSGTVVSGSVILTASATDNVAVTGVTFWAGSTKLATAAKSGSNWAATVNTSAYPKGTYQVTAKAVDAAGNTGVSAPVTLIIGTPVTSTSTPTTSTPTTTTTPPTTSTPTTSTAAVDKTPPTVALVQPAPDATVSGVVNAVVSASDNVGVVAVTFWTGTTKLGDGVQSSPGTWTVAVPTSRYPNGTYTVFARAADAAGNVANTPTQRLTLKN